MANTASTKLLSILGYLQSENFVSDPDALGHSAHLLEAVSHFVEGAYTFRTSPEGVELLTRRPAIYVAEALDTAEARRIHRAVWNQGAVPFLITVLPQEVRVYKGFNFSRDEDDDIVAGVSLSDWSAVQNALESFFAEEIDNGVLWQSSELMQPQDRVDAHLLRNLRALSDHLVNERDLPTNIAHALIGKFIYIRYLVDRKILTPEWLADYDIELTSVLGSNAGLVGLRRLVDILEERFKGAVFPLSLRGSDAPSQDDVKLVAQVFDGMDLPSQQLSLDFKIYDFSYIPIELLSSIYEQFLHVEGKGSEAGAYYTPEPLADYLLAEIQSEKPLERGMRVLDPSCGSGVFLVLAYRRLVALHRAEKRGAKISPEELRRILEESIFGVERNEEACYVAEFSLILTLLGYVEPPDLHHNDEFEFPSLHNRNIFESDFFDSQSTFAQRELTFDWIIGNPPWIELKPASDEPHLRGWMSLHGEVFPVARGRSGEAFLWRATEYVTARGMIALLVHATSLTNVSSRAFRQEFFTRNDVRRVTNFSNLAYSWFAGSAEAPAAAIVFRPTLEDNGEASIIHYGPFAANQVLTRDLSGGRPWVLTVFEDEIKRVSARDARSGDGKVWKLAMWGSYRDERTLSRLRKNLRMTLGGLEEKYNWTLSLGLQLRHSTEETEPIQELSELRGKLVLDHAKARQTGRRFSVPEQCLEPIDDEICFVRKGRTSGLRFLSAPHVWITAEFAAFSEHDFVLRHPQIGLAAGREGAEHLRALSVYFNSSLATYLAFFESAAWGVDRRRINLNEVRQIRAPELNQDQIRELAKVHRRLAQAEEEGGGILEGDGQPKDSKQAADDVVFAVLGISQSTSMIVREFVNIRLELDKGKTDTIATAQPNHEMLLSYGRCLRDKLDDYADLRHRVSVFPNRDMILCEIEIVDADGPIDPVVHDPASSSSDVVTRLWQVVREQRSQWVYVQRSVKIFDGERVVLCKPSRSINWTCTEAMLDCDDIIAEVVKGVGFGQ